MRDHVTPRRHFFWVAVLYFAEGLPYGLFSDVIPVQWRQEGVSLAAIGTLSLLGLAWTLKFLWAPAVDALRHHRRWMAGADLSMAAMALLLSTQRAADPLAWAAVSIFTLCSATNDIAIDGYTIDLLPQSEMGFANGLRIGFYRVGLLAAGLVLASSATGLGWSGAYVLAAAILSLNAILCLRAPVEPVPDAVPTLKAGTELRLILRNPAALALIALLAIAALKLVAPTLHWQLSPIFTDGLLVLAVLALLLASGRQRPALAALSRGPLFGALMEMMSRPGMVPVLLFILTFKLAETAMGFMVKPFWVDAGFSAAQIGLVSVNIGIGLSIAGGLAGGWMTDRLGVYRALWILGLVQALPNLVYAAAAFFMPHAAHPGHGERLLVYAASATESFASGVGTSAFLAFLMAIVDKQRSATEFALLSSAFAFSRSIAGWASGIGAQYLGYPHYFLLTFGLAFPAYLFLPAVRRMLQRESAQERAAPG